MIIKNITCLHMIVKKKAIIANKIFNRAYFNSIRCICSKCKYHVNEEDRPFSNKICDLCDDILIITKLADWNTKYAYLPE